MFPSESGKQCLLLLLLRTAVACIYACTRMQSPSRIAFLPRYAAHRRVVSSARISSAISVLSVGVRGCD